MAKKNIEKWIMNKAMHLGYIRYSVSVGTVIDHYIDENKLIIDGQEFNNVKDLIIVKNREWAVSYTKDALNDLTNKAESQITLRAEQEAGKKPTYKDMPVVQSDTDTHNTIDISYTKKAKDTGTKEIKNDLEVVKYDENSVPIDDVKKSGKMPIVKDDTSYDGSGEGSPSRNTSTDSGRTAEEHASLVEANKEKASKGFVDDRIAKEIEMKKKANDELAEQLNAEQTPSGVKVPVTDSTIEASTLDTSVKASKVVKKSAKIRKPRKVKAKTKTAKV